MKVNVIDDTLITARLIAEYVKKIDGVDVQVFTDPHEGLENCLASEVDLVLVDYMMPDLDGLNFIRQYRDSRSKEEFPIVMVTAMEDREVLRQAFEEGANDFVSKPLEPVELIARANSLLTLRARTVELYRLATVDSLTGVFIRRHFMDLAEKEINRARRYDGPMAMIMLDADHFKSINDTHGHAAGDTVLRAIAETCYRDLRDVDFVGRLGGEEFAICLPETDQAAACEVAERIREDIENLVIPIDDGKTIRLSISVGVSELMSKDCLDDVMRRADAALYEAKKGGRNRVIAAA